MDAGDVKVRHKNFALHITCVPKENKPNKKIFNIFKDMIKDSQFPTIMIYVIWKNPVIEDFYKVKSNTVSP